ncbi:MAG: hypothetical protein HW402_623 [Dehalococcoidales bacterium]|nr:hypothetical protein [Dehalococcoidales bacterium]
MATARTNPVLAVAILTVKTVTLRSIPGDIYGLDYSFAISCLSMRTIDTVHGVILLQELEKHQAILQITIPTIVTESISDKRTNDTMLFPVALTGK